jgi:hypothetical protein
MNSRKLEALENSLKFNEERKLKIAKIFFPHFKKMSEKNSDSEYETDIENSAEQMKIFRKGLNQKKKKITIVDEFKKITKTVKEESKKKKIIIENNQGDDELEELFISEDSEFYGQKVLFEYKITIEEKKIKKHIYQIVQNQVDEIKDFIIKHKYEKTYVLCDFGKRYRTRNVSVFDYMGIHKAIIRPIKMKTFWKIAHTFVEASSESDLHRNATTLSKQEFLKTIEKPSEVSGALMYYNNVERPPVRTIFFNEFYHFQCLLAHFISHIQPDGRSVYVIYDRTGFSGKSTFARFLQENCHEQIHYTKVLNVKETANELHIKINEEGWVGSTIFIDVARAQGKGGLDYVAVEQLADGFMTNTKWKVKAVKSKMHLILLMNQLPDLSKCSADRWKIFTLDKIFKSEEDGKIYNINKKEYQFPESFIDLNKTPLAFKINETEVVADNKKFNEEYTFKVDPKMDIVARKMPLSEVLYYQLENDIMEYSKEEIQDIEERIAMDEGIDKVRKFHKPKKDDFAMFSAKKFNL